MKSAVTVVFAKSAEAIVACVVNIPLLVVILANPVLSDARVWELGNKGSSVLSTYVELFGAPVIERVTV